MSTPPGQDHLLHDALDASPVGERVDVRWSVDGALVRISIRDYGGGVPEDVMPRLFTLVETTKPEGIGLGLASRASSWRRTAAR